MGLRALKTHLGGGWGGVGGEAGGRTLGVVVNSSPASSPNCPD